MFRAAKNIDTAFKDIKRITMTVIILCSLVCIFCIYKCIDLVKVMEDKIYVLANGKALEAYASERKDNVPIEAKDHISSFHQRFFTLSPDDKLIKANINMALYLADESAKREYDNLKEQNYYNNIISGNVSQTIKTDSITIDTNEYPYRWRFYGQQQITRASSVVMRNLITEGYLRSVSRSENNSHGFLIEKWQIIENNDINIKNR